MQERSLHCFAAEIDGAGEPAVERLRMEAVPARILSKQKIANRKKIHAVYLRKLVNQDSSPCRFSF
jgi:hypothetical protein